MLDRPAEMHANIAQAIALGDVALLQKIGKADICRGLVDDQPHRPILGMCAEIDDAMLEPRITHARHGDQHLACEIRGNLLHIPRMWCAPATFKRQDTRSSPQRDFPYPPQFLLSAR